MCVECLFLRHRGPVPYGTNQRAPKWRPTRTPPPVIPVPESLAAQGPYVRLSCPGLARARNVSRHWAPPRACYRVPCCETLKRGTPVAPRRVQGGLSGSPRIRAGTSKRQRSHARHPPLGQPQLNVPRKKSHPRGKPAAGPRTLDLRRGYEASLSPEPSE